MPWGFKGHFIYHAPGIQGSFIYIYHVLKIQGTFIYHALGFQRTFIYIYHVLGIQGTFIYHALGIQATYPPFFKCPFNLVFNY